MADLIQLSILIGYGLLGLYIFWWGYIAAMNIKRVWGKLPKFIKFLVAPGLIIFGFIDFLFNTFVMTVIFRELPQWQRRNQYGFPELLVSDRLYRHARTGTDFTKRFSNCGCTLFLDKFDPTEDHC